MKLLSKLRNSALKLKSEAQVLLLAYKDKRTPVTAKILIGVTVGYLLSPIDLIPDFIPVLGLVDDLIIVPALIAWSISLIPAVVMQDARNRAALHPEQIRKNNWRFAVFIVLVWLVVLGGLQTWLRKRFRGHSPEAAVTRAFLSDPHPDTNWPQPGAQTYSFLPSRGGQRPIG